jgi:hypothetical protein
MTPIVAETRVNELVAAGVAAGTRNLPATIRGAKDTDDAAHLVSLFCMVTALRTGVCVALDISPVNVDPHAKYAMRVQDGELLMFGVGVTMEEHAQIQSQRLARSSGTYTGWERVADLGSMVLLTHTIAQGGAAHVAIALHYKATVLAALKRVVPAGSVGALAHDWVIDAIYTEVASAFLTGTGELIMTDACASLAASRSTLVEDSDIERSKLQEASQRAGAHATPPRRPRVERTLIPAVRAREIDEVSEIGDGDDDTATVMDADLVVIEDVPRTPAPAYIAHLSPMPRSVPLTPAFMPVSPFVAPSPSGLRAAVTSSFGAVIAQNNADQLNMSPRQVAAPSNVFGQMTPPRGGF